MTFSRDAIMLVAYVFQITCVVLVAWLVFSILFDDRE